MPFCSNCGRDLSPSAQVCPNCGHPGPAAVSDAAPVLTTSGRMVEGFAVASLICSIAGFFLIPIVGSILGIVFGGVARRKIAENPSLDGESMARAGIIVGWVGIGLGILFIVLFIVVASAFHNVMF